MKDKNHVKFDIHVTTKKYLKDCSVRFLGCSCTLFDQSQFVQPPMTPRLKMNMKMEIKYCVHQFKALVPALWLSNLNSNMVTN